VDGGQRFTMRHDLDAHGLNIHRSITHNVKPDMIISWEHLTIHTFP
jgi:hypothetical protein